MRVESFSSHGELRDCLDQALVRFLLYCGCHPVLLPNFSCNHPDTLRSLINVKQYVASLGLAGFVLSGGNDIGSCLDRDATEKLILQFAKEKRMPVLGICRGMQMIASFCGGRLGPCKGHVKTRHTIKTIEGYHLEVNSFHNYVVLDPGAELKVSARSRDGCIESLTHKTLPWYGCMWHPEREVKFAREDIKLVERLFCGD